MSDNTSSSGTTTTTTTTAISSSTIIEKASVDTREYRHFQIANAMDVVLISDPDTDKASAACDVLIGQLCDSLQVQGIAHFCEHMLFIGTTKYPTENAYDQYLNTHGGSSNAFTDLEHTCYFFDVQADSLEGAFDRFAQCFIGPLFTQSALEREVQAVDSEHAKNIHQDMWRMYQLSKMAMTSTSTTSATDATTLPLHPYGRFGSGNQKSLPIVNIRERLLEFYQKYYRKSLKLYKLVVLGKQSLDELQAMVEKYFYTEELLSEFPNLKASASAEDKDKAMPEDGKNNNKNDDDDDDYQKMLQELYPPMSLPYKWNVPQQLHVVPVSQVHAVELQFPMPSMWKHYTSKPTHYLSHLIGHEGSGSLLSLLKQKHYALELYADDNSKACIPWLIFTVRAELTELGLQNVDEVITIMFAYIHLLQSQGPQEWIQQELQTVADLQFRFLSKRDPMDYTCSIAGGMQQYQPNHYLSGAYKVYDWDPQAVQSCLQSLTPDNVFIMVSSPTMQGKTTLVEEWYGTEYERIPVDREDRKDVWQKWKTVQHSEYPELKLPQVNDMVATNFDLLPIIKEESIPKDEPQCILQVPDLRLWYKPDNVFSMPKVNLLYSFMPTLSTMDMTMTPESIVAMDVYAELVQEACNEFTYLASMAGLHCTISNAPTSGFSIQASGYNHKAHVLLERIVDTIAHLIYGNDNDKDNNNNSNNDMIHDDVFERIVYKVEQQYQSFLVAQPYSHAVYGSSLCLEMNQISIQDKLFALSNLSKQEVQFLAKRFFKHAHLEGLVHGNVTPQHAKDITLAMLTKLKRTKETKETQENNDQDNNNNTEDNNNNDSNETTTATPAVASSTSTFSSPPLARRVVQFTPGVTYIYQFKEFNDSNTNSCLHYLLQMGPLELQDNATLAFIHHVLREPAFNQLRTEEQLGYIVHSSVKTSGDTIKGLLLMIQSDSFDPIYMEGRVEEFLIQFRTKLVQMSTTEFQSNIDAVVANFLEKNRNLGEESYRYWHVISNQTFAFSRLQQLAKLVQTTMTKQRVLMFYDKYILPTKPTSTNNATTLSFRQKMCVQVFCKAHQEKMKENTTTTTNDNENNNDRIQWITDPQEFKRTMPLYPLPPKVDISVVEMS